MHTKTKKIIAASLVAAIGTGGAKAAQETIVRHGIEDGKAIVVAAPIGNCILSQVFVNGDKTFINVTVKDPNREDATPSGLHVVTARGDIKVDMADTGKGGPGMSMVGGKINTADLLSPLPINPPTPVGTVIADTAEGQAVCGAFAVVPYAGNGNQGQTVG